MTHPERAVRRRAIAKFVADGGKVSAAAAKFNVSVSTVHDAMYEYNVVPPLPMRPAISYTIVAAILNTRLTFRGIAQRYNVSHQRVSQIADKMRAAGIQFHDRQPCTKSGEANC